MIWIIRKCAKEERRQSGNGLSIMDDDAEARGDLKSNLRTTQADKDAA